MGLDLHPAITILLALAPAAHVWWRNRRLVRIIDDPAFPERLFAERIRSRAVLASAAMLLIVTGFARIYWSLPLLVIARMAAAHPFRRIVYEETWSLRAYVWFYLRLCVAFFGFWTFVASLPLLVRLFPSHQWAAAVGLGVLAALWTARFSTIFRKMLRAVPVASPGLIARFKQLETACGLRPVELEVVAMRGGVLANAVAVPSIGRPAVVMTDTLTDRFDDDELTAILAHELAHHEFYNPARLRKMNGVTYALIALGVLVSSVISPDSLLGFAGWTMVLSVSLVMRVQHRQKHETESDLRGVALTGNPEAMIRALTKLNALSRLPRRWSADAERQSTHPSLARRIQAIRDASNLGPAPMTGASSFADVKGTATVTFGEDRLEWSEGATVHQFPYAALGELRIHARSSTQQLIAVDEKGRRWEFALLPSDVARAQATLDSVDGRISKMLPPPASVRASLFAFDPVRIIAYVCVTLGISIGQMAVLIPIVLAALRPASQIVAAAGTAAIAAAILGWRDDPYAAYGLALVWLDAILLLCGVALIALAVKRRHIAESASWKPLAFVGLCGMAAWVIIALSGTARLELYRSVREWPSVSVLTLACAGGLAFSNAKGQRMASPPVAAAGILALFMGTATFAHVFVDDPFVVRSTDVTFKTNVQTPPLQRHPLSFEPSLAWISPSGGYVAISSEDDNENITIHAGRVGDALREYSGDDAAFVSESRLLVLEREPRGAVLHLFDLEAAGREVWWRREQLRSTGLSVDRESGAWRLLGLDQAGDIVSAEGTADDTPVRRLSWRSPVEKRYMRPITAGAEGVVALESVPHSSPIDNLFMRTSFIPPHLRLDTRLWSLTANGPKPIAASRADVECAESATIDEPAICSGFDGTSTRFFTVSAETRQLVPMATIGGRFFRRGNVERGWLSGWMNSRPVLLHAGTAEALSISASSGERVYELAMGDTVLAALAWSSQNGWHSALHIYPRGSISN